MREIKKAIPSILRTMFCFLAWGIVVHALFVCILWILGKWDIKSQLAHPLLSPLNGLRLWIAAGLIFGWIRRNRKPISVRQWSRTLLYMIFFAAFISSLQTYYVHRKNTGWYDLRGINNCYNKYHAFWLIQDKAYFRGIDDCLQRKKTEKKDAFGNSKFQVINYSYNNESAYRPRLMDYDVVTPRLVWVLIAFFLITIIELIRLKGLIGFTSLAANYFRFAGNLFSQNGRKYYSMLLMGAGFNLTALIFLPRINGYPSNWVPLLMLPALLVFSLRLFAGNHSKQRSNEQFVSGLAIVTGALLCNLLLVIFGMKIMYFLLLLLLTTYLISTRKIPAQAVRILILLVVLFEPSFIWADDGTWSEGGLDRLLADSAGPLAVNNAETLTDTVTVSIAIAIPEPEEEDGEVSLTEEELAGNDENNPAPVTTETPVPNPNVPFDAPLGEDPPTGNNTPG